MTINDEKDPLSHKKDWNKVVEDANQEQNNLLAESAKKLAEEKLLDHDEKTALPNPELSALTEKLQAAEAKANDYFNKLLHLQAEMENLRRRSERDVSNAHKYALDKFAGELLPIIDNLERSLEFKVENNELVKNLRAGIELTLSMFLNLLNKHNIKAVNPIAETFNPQWHEAVAVEPRPDIPVNTVVKVLQKGYLIHDRLIRPARVVVSAT